jgi:hypothetical protein
MYKYYIESDKNLKRTYAVTSLQLLMHSIQNSTNFDSRFNIQQSIKYFNPYVQGWSMLATYFSTEIFITSQKHTTEEGSNYSRMRAKLLKNEI